VPALPSCSLPTELRCGAVCRVATAYQHPWMCFATNSAACVGGAATCDWERCGRCLRVGSRVTSCTTSSCATCWACRRR
jgi:hypothetical protein